jgi:hypothetical protein
MNKRKNAWMTDQSGAMSLAVALFLAVVVAAAALGIDFSRLAWVQSELEKAADAGALAGARLLVPATGGDSTPDWLAGQEMALQTVQRNRADAQPLSQAQVEYGYWNMATKTLESAGVVPTALHLPAIRVTVAKQEGENGGPLRLFFAPIFGVATWTLKAQSVAVVSGPYNIPPGGAFPLAVPKEVLDQYQWDREPPDTVRIGGSGDDGQWTSFSIGANDVPTIRELMASGNPSELKIGDNIWIVPGTKTTLYEEAAAKIGGPPVVVPVVMTDFSSQSYTPILGFASLVIEDVQGGDDKYIQGHFVRNVINNASAGGPIYGTMVPAAKLVQ